MGYYVFVDNSNVWIEGKYASAVSKGWASNMIEAHNNRALDNSWKMDFGKLLKFATNGELDKVKDAILIGSRPTEKDSLWTAMQNAGFKVENPQRNASNKEKKVDTGLVHKIDKALYKESSEGDVFVLVLGDKDYLPSIEAIESEGRVAKIVFWSNVAGELTAAASDYVDLFPYIGEITY